MKTPEDEAFEEIERIQRARTRWATVQQPQRTEPVCPECKAGVLYECVACSSNNYPPQRTWVGLFDTDEGVSEIAALSFADKFSFAKAIEAKLRELNNA
jgi:ribosomal protein L37AE/L43A